MIQKEEVDQGRLSRASRNFRDLVNQCLKRDINKRIGSYQDAEELQVHPFFNGLDWDSVESQ